MRICDKNYIKKFFFVLSLYCKYDITEGPGMKSMALHW